MRRITATVPTTSAGPWTLRVETTEGVEELVGALTQSAREPAFVAGELEVAFVLAPQRLCVPPDEIGGRVCVQLVDANGEHSQPVCLDADAVK